MNNLKLILCPGCNGSGVQGGSSSALSCITCLGKGMWLESDDKKQLFFPLPAIESSNSLEQLRYKELALRGMTAVSLGTTTLSAIYLLARHGLSLDSLVWTKGIANAVFGIGGLSSVYALSMAKKQNASTLSLHDLDDYSTRHPIVSLYDFSNQRLERLMRQCATVAAELRTDTVDETILLITLLRQPRIGGMLARLERSASQVETELKKMVSGATQEAVKVVTYTWEVRKRLYQAAEEAIAHDFPYIDLEDVMLAFSKDPGKYEPYFSAFELNYKELYAVSRWYASDQERARQWEFWKEKGRTRPKGYMNRAWTALPTPFLDSYSTDITRLAASGGVPIVSVREQEIAQALQILGRTKKNNVLLVGEPGVGKNSLVGGIARRMIEEKVPEILKDKRLVSMELGALLSGGSSAEENIQRVINEVARAGNVILAIPDIQALAGTQSASLDAATLMATALNRGYVQLISTATYADYHRYIESNPSLAALLEVVEIKEVSVEQAITILEEEAPLIEGRQQVFLTYPAIEAAAQLAKRYLPDKVLPDSALGILDEAASAAHLASRKWVTKDEVVSVIEKKTNIPVKEANDQEAELLLNLDKELHKRVIGQEAAIQAVAGSLRRARAGLHDGKRPISSFLFVGPTGVGKTETAKALAELYFGSSESMIRLDMSEYQDNRSVYRLIGAPAASSESYTEGGSLTQAVREKPFSLILLDELEKADKEVLNLFLQLLDDGRLTENTGRTVHFNNTIIIATSNASTNEITALLQKGLSVDELPRQVMQVLQQSFRPEFLNRFDSVIPFHPLTEQEIQEVAAMMLRSVTAKLSEQGYTVSFDPAAILKIGKMGYDPVFGARPLRRVIQEKVEGLLAELILKKELSPGETLQITAEMIQ